MRKLLARKFTYTDKAIINRFLTLSKLSINGEALKLQEKSNLSSILKHTINHIPFYSSWANEQGVSQEEIEIRPYEVLGRFPIISKATIRNHESSLLSNDWGKRSPYINYTGGSSGEPLKLYQDNDFHKWNEALFLLAKSWRGWKVGDKELLLWGSSEDTFSGKKPCRAKLKDYIYNRTTLNTFSLSDQLLAEYTDAIQRKKPQLIRAYAQSVYQLALFINSRNVSLNFDGSIHCGAGTLYDHMRREIAKAFRTEEIYNHYGSRELGSIASECKHHKGMHIFTNHNYVEILDEFDQPVEDGIDGNIVVTSLNNYTMPLIRYKIGDVGRKSKTTCPCQIAYPMLEKVIGRSTEILTATDGSLVLPEYIIHLIGVTCNDGSINKFQVIQTSLENININIVVQKDRVLSENKKKEITSKIQLLLGNTSINFSIVKDIPKTPSGKYLYVVSKIER